METKIVNNSKRRMFAWRPVNGDNFEGQYECIEDLITDVTKQWEYKAGEYYGNDDRYLPTIQIGELEMYNFDGKVNDLVEDIKEYIKDYFHNSVEEFAFGTDCETEVDLPITFTEDLAKILKGTYVYSSHMVHILKGTYDLFSGWCEEEVNAS